MAKPAGDLAMPAALEALRSALFLARPFDKGAALALAALEAFYRA